MDLSLDAEPAEDIDESVGVGVGAGDAGVGHGQSAEPDLGPDPDTLHRGYLQRHTCYWNLSHLLPSPIGRPTYGPCLCVCLGALFCRIQPYSSGRGRI